MTVITASDATFTDLVLHETKPVLVYFWAEWCAPCKTLGPIVEDLAREFEGQIKFLKIDVEACPVQAANHSIRSLPTLCLYQNGRIAAMRTGGATNSALKEWIRSV